MLQIWGGSLCYRQAQSINVNKKTTKTKTKKKQQQTIRAHLHSTWAAVKVCLKSLREGHNAPGMVTRTIVYCKEWQITLGLCGSQLQGQLADCASCGISITQVLTAPNSGLP